jgi:hypothetical protein
VSNSTINTSELRRCRPQLQPSLRIPGTFSTVIPIPTTRDCYKVLEKKYMLRVSWQEVLIRRPRPLLAPILISCAHSTSLGQSLVLSRKLFAHSSFSDISLLRYGSSGGSAGAFPLLYRQSRSPFSSNDVFAPSWSHRFELSRHLTPVFEPLYQTCRKNVSLTVC